MKESCITDFDMPDLAFTPPYVQKTGTIAAILKACYTDLVASDPECWSNEIEGWERFDTDVYEDSDGIGDCTFLSWLEDKLIGFASYDPRQWPALGIVGHNAILPKFQGRGFGKQQIAEILRRFQKMGFKKAKVSTLDHPFFNPAQAMYLACGFCESRRIPWVGSPKYQLIEYEKDLQ
ncbi:MAG: GNAT family N-acetyltransferase [Candidatus Aminicenantes bacterium]|nr:MAG: GNAT family N-acetyltransferase [Candidatus Aminicenantes bacterium]